MTEHYGLSCFFHRPTLKLYGTAGKFLQCFLSTARSHPRLERRPSQDARRKSSAHPANELDITTCCRG